MSSFVYFFKESINGFTRNLGTTLGSITTIFLSLLIIGVFLVGGLIVNNIVSEVEDKVSITAYISDDADENAVSLLEDTIRNIEGVHSVTFTTKEQALENFKSSMSSNKDIIEQLDGVNPLPASVDIELQEAQSVESVVEAISNNSVFLEVCDTPQDPRQSLKYGGEETIKRLLNLTTYIRYVGVALIGLLIFIALVFINNTIRLAILARRREIAIMRLVGASNGFIRGPFLMEGALHAIIGSLLAILSLQLIRIFALSRVSNALMWLPTNISAQAYLYISIILLVIGLVIASFGSMIAMRRYLKV